MNHLKLKRIFGGAVMGLYVCLASLAMGEEFQGELEVIYIDYFHPDKDKIIYQLRDQKGQSIKLNFPDGIKKDHLTTGLWVTVQGTIKQGQKQTQDLNHNGVIGQQKIESVISVESLDVVSSNKNLNVNALNDRNAIVMMVDFNDKKASDITSITSIDSMMYSGTKSTDRIYDESSFGKVRFIADTDGDGDSDIIQVTLNYDAGSTCDYNQWANDAEAAASNMGVNLGLYQHRVTVLSNQVGCGWGGLGHLGCGSWCRSWVKWHSTIVYAHELGHNLKMHHASTDPENDGTINSEYGDHSGIMGNNSTVRQVNGPHRIQLDWYSDFPNQVKEVTSNETLNLYPLENDPTDGTQGLQIISVPKLVGSEKYYLTYRKNIGTFGMGSTYRDKVNVHRFTGGSSKTVFIKALATGDTFEDAGNQIQVVALDAGGDTASVQISVGPQEPDVTIQNASFLGAHDWYLVAEGNGGSDVNANRTSIGAWETFDIKLESSSQNPDCIQNGDLVSVSTQGGFYLTATQDGQLNANATTVGASETFTIISGTFADGCIQSGDIVSLKSTFDLYVVAERNGAAHANRQWLRSWERFVLTF